MKRLLKAAALLMLCSLPAGCETARVATAVKPPASRMDCVELTERPTLPAEYVIDWSKVTTVPQAQSEQAAFVRSVRAREGVAAGYIVEQGQRIFACANDAAWLRDFYARLPGEAVPDTPSPGDDP